MAIRGTLTHRKTRKLAQMLGISPCFALGIQEALWHVTAEQAPTGNIGRMSNADIAMEMFYDGDFDKLIAALLACVLLDEHPEHRLIVHDWHIYADDAVDVKLARSVQHYANGMLPRMRRLSKAERAELAAQFEAKTSLGTSAHNVRTESHAGRKPEPEPGPEPVQSPAGGAPTPDMVAGAVMAACGIAGAHTRRVLATVVRTMSATESYSAFVAEAQLIKAWKDYERLKSQLKITWGAEKFFGDGHWRTPDAWPRKEEGQKRPFDPCAQQPIVVGRLDDKIDEFFGITPGDLDRWREKRDRGEPIPPAIIFALDRKRRSTKGTRDANDDTKTA